MFAATRIITSIIMLLAIVGALIFAFVLKIPILVLVWIIIQVVAWFWYTLSFIPFGRKLFTYLCKNCCL